MPAIGAADRILDVDQTQLVHELAPHRRTSLLKKLRPDAELFTATGVDNDFAARSFTNVGAWIMGRSMFGPIRGPWPDENWKGWWGDNPPYHCPVFVLTHHERAPVTMAGGTIFHFVTDGIEAALERALQAANGKGVRVGGGAATIRQYLRTGLIDEMHFAISPVLLGSGEHLFADINTAALGYRCTEHLPTQNATHVVLTK
jgi:dihydrofolate reductase